MSEANELELTKEVTDVVQQQKTAIDEKVRNSPEVQAIVKQIDVQKPDTILTFGSNSAQEISRFADTILHSMESTNMEDAGRLIGLLNKIMDKFDIKDFDKNEGLLAKLFHRADDAIERLFKKYHTMGDEVDKVFVTLKQYESETSRANGQLDEMFNRNLSYYEDLQRYIMAGEMALEELDNKLLPAWEKHANESGDQMAQLAVQNLRQAREMVEQRVYDLRLAENVALQSMPLIKSIQQGNYSLIRKINSAFIVTLPIFKQALTQSIMLKRQALQAKAMKALDEKTNELLIRNAENTANQARATAELASGSFVEIETLEKTWQTIMKGIEDTRMIQQQAQQKREDGTRRLEEFKKAFEDKKMLQA